MNLSISDANLSPQSLCCLAKVGHCLFLICLFLLLK